MRAVTPFGALSRGLLAGAAGSGTQSLFLAGTSKFAPRPSSNAFTPPEEQPRTELPTETIARRWATGLMALPAISSARKKQLGQVVHFAFGAGWGGLYGVARETFPWLGSPAGALSYGTLVWVAGDNAMLAAFRLAGPPHRYAVKLHLYAWLAHVAYAAGLWGTYEVLRPRSLVGILGEIWSLRAQRRINAHLPRRLRPLTRRVVKAVAPVAAWRPDFRGAVEALR